MEIKLVHVLGGFGFGGIEKLVCDLVACQKKNSNLFPEILVLRDEGEFADKYRHLGIKIHAINPSGTHRFGWKHIRLIAKCFKSADLIHLHVFHLLIALLTIQSRKKIIYTEHGNFCFGRKTRTRDRISHLLRYYFYKWFVHTVACNSRFTQEYLYDSWSLKDEHVKVIYNGSNHDVKANPTAVKEIRASFMNRFIVGTTSRLAGFKRVDRLINAIKLFSQINEDVVLLVVGEGPEKEILKNQAEENFMKNVYFVGYKADVFDYQSAFDICVFPSQNEPFGLVAVEAYNANKPVLVFRDGGGLTEIVSKCDTNDIVGTIEEMVKRLEYYYNNRNIKKEVKNVLDFFSVERMENNYYQEYKSLLCAV